MSEQSTNDQLKMVSDQLKTLSLSKAKSKPKNKTVNQKLYTHIKSSSKKFLTNEEILNIKVDRAINSYQVLVLENKNFDVKKHCVDSGISFAKFKDRYKETRNEPFRIIKYNDNSSNNTKKYLGDYRDAKMAILENTATQEQKNLVSKRQEGIKKSQFTKLTKKFGDKEGTLKYKEWIKKYEEKELKHSPITYKKYKGGANVNSDDDEEKVLSMNTNAGILASLKTQ